MFVPPAEIIAPISASPQTSQRRSITGALLAICLPTYLIFAGAKFIELNPGFHNDWRMMAAYPIDVATLSFQDLLYVLAIAILAYLPLRLTTDRPRTHRAIWIALIGFMLLNVIYAAVNIKLYSFLGTPLTFPLLRMAGDVKSMRESTGTFVTFSSVAWIVLAPIIFLVLARSGVVGKWFEGRAVRWLLVVVFIIYAAFEPYSYGRRVAATAHETFARNIVCHFLLSCSSRLEGSESASLDQPIDENYFRDFQTFAQRSQPAHVSEFSRPKNVIVIVLESVNAMYMSLYGSKYQTTPNLEEAAKHSLVFDNVYAHAGYTAHSLIPLAMSIYSGMGWRIYVEDYPKLPGETLAQALKPHGFRTAFITSQDLDFQNMGKFLSGRGFDVIKDFSQLGKGLRMTGWGGDDRDLIDGMLSWIDENPSQPFFAMGWTQQTHHPYQLAPGEKGIEFLHDDGTQRTRELNRFLSALHVTDEQLQRLRDGLAKRGLADDTMIVVTGDHGEAFGSPHKWYSHGTSLYEENVRVPMMFINAKMFPAGRRLPVVGGHIDMNPTIVDLLGIAPPSTWQGTSLFDPAHPGRVYFATVAASYLMGMREADWKFIFNATFGKEELYDLSHDPTEQTNLASQYPDVCKKFRGRLSAWVRFEKQHMNALLGSGPGGS